LGAPGWNRPSQSVALGEVMPLHVTVSVPPDRILAGLADTVGPLLVTATLLLVASSVNPSFAKRRSW
jgi:hypothetical protein